ncbi:MAG: ABC transporter ATP-binding protein [Pseudomonadota bacterium]
MAESVALNLQGVGRRYHDGSLELCVLDDLNLQVQAGESIAVMGASGSGKSTLLHLAGGMDLPDQGRIEVFGQVISELAEPERTQFRARRIGLVFQDYNLIESLTAFENIELALWLTGQATSAPAIYALAEELSIADLLQRRPSQLSGGEQQRVAIARALIHRPGLLLADEPTGSLDQATAEQVLDILQQALSARGCAMVMVTHSDMAAAVCDRTLAFDHGRLIAA